MRPARSVTAQSHPFERLLDPPWDVGRFDLASAQTVGDIALHREIGKDRIVLEDHAGIAMMRRQGVDASIIEPYAARFELGKARDQSQQRGLAASGGSEKGEQPTLLYSECNIVDGTDGAESAADVVETERRHEKR